MVQIGEANKSVKDNDNAKGLGKIAKIKGYGYFTLTKNDSSQQNLK